MLLALDPGERKIGWALVAADGTPVAQGIWPAGPTRADRSVGPTGAPADRSVGPTGWTEHLLALPQVGAIETLVIGDGTASMNIAAELARLLPQCRLAVVGERESTVEGWQLKRAETCRGNPLRALWFTLRQLWDSAPVDNYAARVLALRYLAGQ